MLLFTLSGASALVRTPRPHVCAGAGRLRRCAGAQCSAVDRPPLQQELLARRRIKTAGLVLGTVMLGGGSAAGLQAGMFDARLLETVFWWVTVFGSASLGLWTLRHDEWRETGYAPVEVKESPGMGQGLFATASIGEGTFLFPYAGEVLSEDEFFARYPTGQGRYVAGVGDVFIDGSDEKYGPARWMNHGSAARANVRYKKQRFGPLAPAMYFYAASDIAPGAELLFDCELPPPPPPAPPLLHLPNVPAARAPDPSSHCSTRGRLIASTRAARPAPTRACPAHGGSRGRATETRRSSPHPRPRPPWSDTPPSLLHAQIRRRALLDGPRRGTARVGISTHEYALDLRCSAPTLLPSLRGTGAKRAENDSQVCSRRPEEESWFFGGI